MAARKLAILVERAGTEVYRSQKPGVVPLIELVERFPRGLDGAVVADRVVGGCAARILAWLRVMRVHAAIGSAIAGAVLKKSGIDYLCRREVAQIRNRTDTGVCPFEALSQEHQDPGQLIAAVKSRLRQTRPGSLTRPRES
ncbi:MAG: DUF1893 domain-containing protein [candidate division WOR-3 bacterium]|nr:MAG: DUF1893 domain-containing protein [candidate division WOR-3 bacterium]